MMLSFCPCVYWLFYSLKSAFTHILSSSLFRNTSGDEVNSTQFPLSICHLLETLCFHLRQFCMYLRSEGLRRLFLGAELQLSALCRPISRSGSHRQALESLDHDPHPWADWLLLKIVRTPEFLEKATSIGDCIILRRPQHFQELAKGGMPLKTQ